MPLTGRVEMDDAYLGGRRSGAKRGRGAPGKTPFVAAVQTTAEGQPVRIKLRRVKGFRKSEIAKMAKRDLSRGDRFQRRAQLLHRRHHAGLCASSDIHRLRTRGRRRARLQMGQHHPRQGVDLKNTLRGTYHAIRPKHVPRYLAAFQYRYNRRYRLADMIEALGRDALRTPPMPYRLLKLAEVSA